MTGSIICGMDDSESGRRAARVARGLSSKLGFRLVFVHVVEAGSPHEKISAVADRLQRLSEGCAEVDCGAGWLVDVGHPVDRLVAAAKDEEARFIVVGSQGRRSSLLGSVSAEVSRRAPCPVVVVPPGADEYPIDGDRHSEVVGGVARFTSRSRAGRRLRISSDAGRPADTLGDRRRSDASVRRRLRRRLTIRAGGGRDRAPRGVPRRDRARPGGDDGLGTSWISVSNARTSRPWPPTASGS